MKWADWERISLHTDRALSNGRKKQEGNERGLDSRATRIFAEREPSVCPNAYSGPTGPHRWRKCCYKLNVATFWLCLITCYTLVYCLAAFSTLKMEVIRSSEASVHIRSTLLYVPEDVSVRSYIVKHWSAETKFIICSSNIIKKNNKNME
jgi:hypothetical protein